MRISDWSSDVCSSDLGGRFEIVAATQRDRARAAFGQGTAIHSVPSLEHRPGGKRNARIDQQHGGSGKIVLDRLELGAGPAPDAGHAFAAGEIGRESGWERVCQEV